jgi:hypothetical protein
MIEHVDLQNPGSFGCLAGKSAEYQPHLGHNPRRMIMDTARSLNDWQCWSDYPRPRLLFPMKIILSTQFVTSFRHSFHKTCLDQAKGVKQKWSVKGTGTNVLCLRT